LSISSAIAVADLPLIDATRIATIGVSSISSSRAAWMTESIPACWFSCTSKKTTFARASPRRRSSDRRMLYCT
jgi:hypothetical protein